MGGMRKEEHEVKKKKCRCGEDETKQHPFFCCQELVGVKEGLASKIQHL